MTLATHGPALAVLALIVAGCAAAPAGPRAQAPAAQPSGVARATPAPVVPVPAADEPRDLVAVRVGADPATRRIQLVDAVSGAVEVDLPDGVIDREAGLVYVAQVSGAGTAVTSLEISTGAVRATMAMPGRLSLPTIGVDADPVGLSGDGRTLALDVHPGPLAKAGPGSGMDEAVSRFAVLPADLQGKPVLVELPGRWSFDALSPDGRVLFLVEHLTTGGVDEYQVRAYDVPAGTLREQVVVDKRAGGLLMEGTPVAQTTTSRGEWVYTLYRNRAVGPFVHALQAGEVWALCIFPTARDPEADEARAAAGWDLVLSEAAGALYAVNGALGRVTRIPTADPLAARTVSFAEAGGPQTSARGAALSPDARTLHVASGESVVQLDAASLAEGDRTVGSGEIAALAARPAGGLYATSRTGALTVVGPAGPGAAVALGAAPARILWVTARR